MAEPAPPDGFTVDETPPAGFTVDQPIAAADSGVAATSGPQPQGFNDAQKHAILAYLPHAQSAADLEDYASQLTHGQAKIGNAQATLDAYHQGHRQFAWAPSQQAPAQEPGVVQQLGDNLKNDVAGIAQGAAALPDMAATAAGRVISIIPTAVGAGLDALGFHNAANVSHDIAHDLANPVRIGDVIESAAPTPDTTSGKVNRFVGQMVGGAAAVPTSALEGVAAKIVGEVPKGFVDPATQQAAAASDAAKSAQDLNIDLPAFTVRGPAAQAKAASLTRKGGFGATGLGESAQTAIDQSKSARDTIAQEVGTPQALDANLGSDIKNAAVDARTEERARIGRMFDAGDQQMGDTPIPLKNTTQAISDLAAQDKNAIVPSPATPLLSQIQQRINDLGGTMTAANLRASTQNLKALMKANSIDATTSDHIMGAVRDAMNGDMEAAAKQSGNESALQTYQDAREQWAASKTLDKTVLKPILGTAFQNTGDQVVNSIKTAVKNNGTRVAQLFSALPDDVANTARASLIARMGTPVGGNPNDYSLVELAKNYSQLAGSKRLIFAPETVQALDKLASVAQYGKSLQAVAANGAKAGPFGVKKLMTSGPAVLGEAAVMFTHDVKDLAMGTAASALSALGQWRSAKLLASPDFAKRLANMPTNPKAVASYWSRPWVNGLAVKNPAIAAEVQAFQYHVLNDNSGIVTSAAASPNSGEQNQHQ